MKNGSPISAANAVLRGHLVVTLPMLVILGIVALIVYSMIGPPSVHEGDSAMQFLHAGRIPVGVVVGAMVGWLWWSATVPRWREWARINGADEERTQFFAVRTFLVWPKGSFFEKTEFRLRRRN